MPKSHLSDNVGAKIGQGETGKNSVVVKQRESGYIFPSFLVKSSATDAKTASYTITYKLYEPDLGLTHTESERYNNVVFSNYLDGEADRFPAIKGGLDKNSYFVVTMTVHSLS